MKSTWPILTVALLSETDIVTSRQRARELAEALGFDARDQTRIATAVSEIARNAFEHGGGGRVVFALDPANRGTPQALVITITDAGAGIADLSAVLEGRGTMRPGKGIGLVSAKRLVDEFQIESTPGQGTSVELRKAFAARQPAVTQKTLKAINATLLGGAADPDPLVVLAEQNRELIGSLDDLKHRQDELAHLNRELEDTNRGVVALYAELDERAEQLRQASEAKTRFLSNMSHEFRTPLHSILALSRLLLDRVDGELTGEQERQVGFIRQSAENLSDLVNDLLDIAKVEAGKVDLRPAPFTVEGLFGALRGAMKPLQKDKSVELIFEEPAADLPEMINDEAKVAQILRNFISNALKFTERGEVRVSARFDGGNLISFRVADTGIGIAPQDQLSIFEEFVQVDSQIQRNVKGTGLGLPLSRRLAELLGGEIIVESELGRGSVFIFSLPHDLRLREADPAAGIVTAAAPVRTILIVDDDEVFRYALAEMIKSVDPLYRIEKASNGVDALAAVERLQPDAIFLDLQMPRLDGFAVLDRLSSDPSTRHIPVVVSTSVRLDAAVRERLSAARTIISKEDLSRETIRIAIDKSWAERS